MKNKIISIFLLVTILITLFQFNAFAADDIDYTIINPYESVDWDTWDYYKACLHCHSNASDGRFTLTEMMNEYYNHDFDIVALTDHGVINPSWTSDRKVYPPFNLMQKFEPMTQERYDEITNGVGRNGRKMIDITGGIELNMATLTKTHVNGYFTTYGNGVYGRENDYRSGPINIEAAGGYSVLNHVGDWVDSNHYPERSHDKYIISYFADIFTSCKSCLGMEIVNSADNVSRGDRALWDEILKVVIPTGRNVWAFSDDDSEYLDEVGRSFEYFVLPENTVDNVKNAMINGNLFSCSIFAKSEIGPDFKGNGEVPLVKKINVDQDNDSIKLTLDETRDCSAVEWVYDNKVIATGTEINLDDYKDEIGCYIRFQLKGEGGITYSQAFELQYEGRPEYKPASLSFFRETLVGNIMCEVIHSRFFAIAMFLVEKIGNLIK